MSDGVSISKGTQEEEKPNESIIASLDNIYTFNSKKDGDGISVVSSTDTNNNKNHVKLHEMGEQLEIAENRCNTLKTQLDAMKQIYNTVQERTQEVTRPAQKHIKRHSSSKVKNMLISSTAKLIRGGSRCIEDSSGDCKPDNISDQYVLTNRLPRQQSIAIGTDNTDEAVNTINNILSGITTSVNRLSEIHASMESDKRPPTPIIGCRLQADAITDNTIINFDETATGVDMVKVTAKVPQSTVSLYKAPSKQISTLNTNSPEKEKKQRKRSQSRSSAVQKNSTNDIILINKLSGKSSKSSTVKTIAKHSQKRLKLANNEEVPSVETKSASNTALKNKKSLKRLKQSSRSKMPEVKTTKQTRGNNLVEIYHNVAAKAGSDSEDSQHLPHSRNPTPVVPPISVECPTAGTDLEQERLSPIAENGFSDPQKITTSETQTRIVYNEYGQPINNYQSRSYQLPTIASKLKQVAKSYIQQINFRTIPFCVATSTSPSHNIGVNIQQVMNILKNRQSFNGISPTLAHNIGIAAEKLHTAPYGDIVSSLSSKIIYGKAHCPLRQNVNYQQLQEMAKDISEDSSYMDQNNMQSQNTENDVSENTVWTMDPTKSNCTCINPSGIGFQQVSSRNRYASSISSNRDVQRSIKSFTKTQQNVPINKNTNRQMYNWEEGENQNFNTTVIKEKNLKCVLTNLHDEFDGLNKNYEALSKQINTGELFGDKEAIAELEHLEKQLTDKEEEIKIVMALYKEVATLKTQVRELKQKASQASLYIQQQLQQQQHHHHQMSQMSSQQPVHTNQWQQQYGQQPNTCAYPQAFYQTPSRRASMRTRECKDPMAALHLTKLLKQIQTYQEFYRNGR